jgi:hypothetical protein
MPRTDKGRVSSAAFVFSICELEPKIAFLAKLPQLQAHRS